MLNTNNVNNGQNLNFNSDNANLNNNNRDYGFSVRGVLGSIYFLFKFDPQAFSLWALLYVKIMAYKLTKDQLFFDLYAAFLCAKKA